jgi:hypothetical protein
MKKKSLILYVFIALIISACSSAMRGEAPGAPAMEMAQDFGGGFDDEMVLSKSYAEAEEANFSTDSTGDSPEAVQRMVIKNADLSIVVDDPVKKLDTIADIATEMGGFVVNSHVWQNTLHNGAKVPHANITIRIPVERLEEALANIKAGVGEITSENVSGQDVTSDYTDLKSRLRNLEAAEEQLQMIMDEARKTEDVLQVYNNLVNVREQIEVIRGQMEYYEESARLSRISVDITGDEEAQPLQIGGWKPAGVAKDAIETMVNALQWLGDAAIWVVLCVLPIGIIVGIPLFFVGRYLLRIRNRRKEQKAADEDIAEKIKNEGDVSE